MQAVVILVGAEERHAPSTHTARTTATPPSPPLHSNSVSLTDQCAVSRTLSLDDVRCGCRHIHGRQRHQRVGSQPHTPRTSRHSIAARCLLTCCVRALCCVVFLYRRCAAAVLIRLLCKVSSALCRLHARSSRYGRPTTQLGQPTQPANPPLQCRVRPSAAPGMARPVRISDPPAARASAVLSCPVLSCQCPPPLSATRTSGGCRLNASPASTAVGC